MDVALSSLISLYTFSTGRRLFAMQQVKKAAAAMGFAELEAHAAAAVAHDQKTREFDARWSASLNAPQGQADVRRIDILVDQTLTALRDAAEAQARGAGPDEEIAGKVDGLLRSILPAGLQAVTHIPYVEELAALDVIIAKLQGELASIVSELGLKRLAQRLATLTTLYRAAQEEPAAPSLYFSTVRAARAKGQECMLIAVAMILGKYPTSSPEDVAARTALLGPILRQNEAIRQYRRARSAVEDINPDTGELDPTAPATGGGEGDG